MARARETGFPEIFLPQGMRTAGTQDWRQIGALLERFPHLRLADESPVWRVLPVFRGLAKLRVLVAAP